MSASSVLVVGAGPAGLSTAEMLRRKGFDGALTLLGAEAEAPYDRPPLSKQVLSGQWDPERALLRDEARLAELDASLVLGEQAVDLDVAAREVRTGSGFSLSADAIVLATGVRPKTLPGQDELDGAHVLRTLADCAELRSDLQAGARLVVVGDGVLGAEVAATACQMGLDVTMVGPQSVPMAEQLGPVVGARLADVHVARGVELRLGSGVRELVGEAGRVAGARLESGEVLEADVVLVAIGAEPAADWLGSSGLELNDGVVCDSCCRAAEGIYAVGDVARWWHEDLGRLVRLENRTNATEQARAVAGGILGEHDAFTPVPHFWTDQFDVKIQTCGVPTADAEVSIVDGSPESGRFVARYALDGSPTGFAGWNMPKQARLRRAELVAERTGPDLAHR